MADDETQEPHPDVHEVEGEASADATDAGDDDGSPNTPAQELQKKPEGSEVEEIEHDREERLDPDNRPEDAEVDNTGREFDEQKGMFTDAEDYDEAPTRFPPAAEQAT